MAGKKKWILPATALIVLLFVGWVLWANTAVEVTHYTVAEENLPYGFYGYRIAHVSDLHSADFYGDVIEKLRQEEPDIICITGDLMDSRDTSGENALAFARDAAKIAPCYYIAGNHEARLEESLSNKLMMGLAEAGVTVLKDEEILLTRGGDTVSLTGYFGRQSVDIDSLSEFGGYRILLSHIPERFLEYCDAGYDLVLSGHAHGGQFRLPFIGGLFAPGQGVFPQYDAGVFSAGRTDMVVSRGIGNSSFPLRFYNRPELIIIELKCTLET